MTKGRFNRFLLVFVVIAAMFLSVGLQNAKGEALLFPYYRSGNGAVSFLSLVNTWGDPNLWYYWNYDDLSTAAKECIHEDAGGSMTAFDLIQQTVTDPSLSGIDIDAMYGDASTPAYSLVSPAEGYLIVDSPNSVEGDFYGQMIIVDAATGLVEAYKGLNDPTNQSPNTFTNVTVSHWSYMMSNYPSDVVDTSWYVLVTGTGMAAAPGWTGRVTLTQGFPAGVWNRDEDPRSGVVDKNITCFDTVERSDIMTAAQVSQTNNGGLWWEVLSNPINGATGGLMVKIEHTTALGSEMTVMSSENAFPNDPY